MKLTEEQKQLIIDILDSEEFKTTLYEGLDEDKRNALGQFYTPAKVCIKMIEMFDCESFADKPILDPTCGSGNLLIAMLCAGADSDKIYGNDYDKDALDLAYKRINRACDLLNKPHIRNWQLHQGNALQVRCLTEFDEEYTKNYNPKYINYLEYAQGNKSWEQENRIGENLYRQEHQEEFFTQLSLF